MSEGNSNTKRPKKTDSIKSLAPAFRQWLLEDVSYIINQDEKREFLALHNDDERDNFIKNFWELRNPEPGSSVNTYKEEHYRRIAYANSHWGDDRYHNGWDTDMGRVYITLGPPKQMVVHNVGRRTRPMQTWFYAGTSPALPPFFNVVFFKESDNEEWKLYSPLMDGAAKLVTDQARDTKEALHIIQQSMGGEAVHTAMSLLPDEPYDAENPKPTMGSEILLGKIRDLPDQPLEKARLAAVAAARQEKVTSSISFAHGQATLETTTLRDDQGRETLHVLLNNGAPDSRIVAKLPDGRMGYDMILNTRIRKADGTPIYLQKDKITARVPTTAVEATQTRNFGVEARLPLVPGTYSIEAVLVNELNQQGVHASKTLRVPETTPGSLGMSDLIFYRKPAPQQDPGAQLPFSMAKLRFAPRGVGFAEIAQGEQLPLVYQIWLPPGTAAAAPAAKPTAPMMLHVHYLVGIVAEGASTSLVEDEDIAASNLDAAGNLLTGHTVNTSNLPPGDYRVVVKVSDPATNRFAVSSMSLDILSSEEKPTFWTAYGPESDNPEWREELLRGIAYEANGNIAAAEASYKSALALQADAPGVQERLDAVHKKLQSAVVSPHP